MTLDKYILIDTTVEYLLKNLTTSLELNMHIAKEILDDRDYQIFKRNIGENIRIYDNHRRKLEEEE